jgi:hypothetical protein
MVVRLPQEKIAEIIQKIEAVLPLTKVRLQQLQSLIGSLNFCCRAVSVGRPFCRRLINATCGINKPYHRVRVTQSMKLDLELWLFFFKACNGISVFHDRFWVSASREELFTDSAGGLGRGFGIYFQGDWCCAPWPMEWHNQGKTKDITVLELFPIFLSVVMWGDQLKNKRLIFNCDNSAVVQIVNSLSSKSEQVMQLVRVLTLYCLKYNILLKAQHVPGVKNEICDALSRFQLERFRKLAPEAAKDPVPVPTMVWDVFTRPLRNWLEQEFRTILR